MEEGPWLFRECALMLERFDGATTIPTVIPNKVEVWIQIHRIPPLYRTEAILKQLAGKVGEVVKVELKVISAEDGEFQRARVKLTAGRPLMRVVTLSPEGLQSMLMQVKYEKAPKFCDHCGLMGHGALECGTGEHADDELNYGDWILAPMETWHPETPRVRGGFGWERDAGRGGRGFADHGGRSAGRGVGRFPSGGRGRQGAPRGGGRAGAWREKEAHDENNMASRKRNSGDVGLAIDDANALADTASSPLKPVQEGEEPGKQRPKAKKQLLLLASEGEAGESIPPPPPSYTTPKELKRQKKEKAAAEASTILANKTKAGSTEERRQHQ